MAETRAPTPEHRAWIAWLEILQVVTADGLQSKQPERMIAAAIREAVAEERERCARVANALHEVIDIIDQGDLPEVWQVALINARLQIASARDAGLLGAIPASQEDGTAPAGQSGVAP